jgi:DNA/RNA-binding domain of Phe-tRNA-synthetase-like protein
MPYALTIDPALERIVQLGVLLLKDVRVAAEDPRLVTEVDEACASFRRTHGDIPSGNVPGTEVARGLYKALGIDPTRTRPSNESLLRRALKGEALYRINTAVDAINLCSLVHQLPYGLYDADRVAPPVVLRKGGPGEWYEGIRKGEIHLDGRPTLADARGPFGNPTSDSARTSVGLETHALLVTVYAPRAMARTKMDSVLDATLDVLTRHVGGTCAERQVL